MPAQQYIALHEFTTRVDENTGKEKTFQVGDLYDGPPERLDVLLDPKAFPDQGFFLAAKGSDQAKAAEAVARQRVKDEKAAEATEPAQPASEGN